MATSSNLTWSQARVLAIAGNPIRRSGWVDRWWKYDQCLWWTEPYNAVTKVTLAPRVILATDITSAEFEATDWTTDDVGASKIHHTSLEFIGPDAPEIPSKKVTKLAGTTITAPFTGVCDLAATISGDIYIAKTASFLYGGSAANTNHLQDGSPASKSIQFWVVAGEVFTLDYWDIPVAYDAIVFLTFTAS